MPRAALIARIALAGALALGSTAAAALPAAAQGSGTTERTFVVRAQGALTRAGLQRSVGSALAIEAVSRIGSGIATVTARFPSTTSAASAASALRATAAISDAARQAHLKALGAPAPVRATDPEFGQQWSLWDASSVARAGGYGIDASRAWAKTLGSAGVVVAVLDTGITQQPDLAGVHLAAGYDFVDSDTDPTDPGDACADTGEPSSWHGTFVAGEIGAQQGSTGVSGAAPGVTIEPIRVLGACGGDESATIRGILWAAGAQVTLADNTAAPANPQPASIISMSLGGADTCDAAMQSAIDTAVAHGVVVVAAAGNDGGAIADSSPAGCKDVISVVATTRSGHLASYTNHGTTAGPATIAAPGGDTDRSNVRSGLILGDSWSDTGAYTGIASHASLEYDAGTSMATPLVSSAVALLESVRPGLTPQAIAARLTASATPFPRAAHCTAVVCGAGIVNAGNLVHAAKRFVRVAAPRIAGKARPGARLTARLAKWRSASTHTTFRWTRDGMPIRGATHAHLTVTRADRGHRIAVIETAHRTGYARLSATSAAVRVPR